MPKTDYVNKEIGRITVSDSTAIVVTESYKKGDAANKVVRISPFVTTEGYTGFTKGGVTLPRGAVEVRKSGKSVVLKLSD